MLSTIESAHNKINDKITLIKDVIYSLRDLLETYSLQLQARSNRKQIDAMTIIDNLRINLIADDLENAESEYQLSVVSILADYYSNPELESKATKDYYRVITSENFVAKFNEFIPKANAVVEAICNIAEMRVLGKAETKETEIKIEDARNRIQRAEYITVDTHLEKSNYEICECGTKMTVIPELSELKCDECGQIRVILGAVFRDDQFYPQDGQKTKHGSYDPSRHYRFWMERLQALENKTFDKEAMDEIDYVIARDSINRKELTCALMRSILKERKLARLNDHAPLLVKQSGGPSPPQLDFQEHRDISIKFSKIMALYERLRGNTSGNRPYYPYFIYKIVEHKFANNHDKLRLLDSIHLQSPETVMKNDKIFKKICEMAEPEDDLKYQPTDYASRL